jgi:hypothetical protein
VFQQYPYYEHNDTCGADVCSISQILLIYLAFENSIRLANFSLWQENTYVTLLTPRSDAFYDLKDSR